MTSKTVRYVAVTIAVILGVVLFAILTIFITSYLIRRKRALRSSGSRKRLHSQYSFISPHDHPQFVIPPYPLDEDAFESGSESPLSVIHEETAVETSSVGNPSESPVLATSKPPLGTPTFTRPQFQRSVSDLEGRISSRERVRPKYRRILSSVGGSPLAHQHASKEMKKSSLSPEGKIQASIQFSSNKNLLIVQVNGMYDLPQLRTSGISTPYVRVNLISGDDEKDMRTNFMNLSTNRICVFDRITLEKAKESTIKFVVLDYDKFSRSEYVAETSVSLNELNLEEGETVMKKLVTQDTSEHDVFQGTLTVSLCQEPTTRCLVVHVIKAENLPSHKTEDALDSFVRVTYCLQEKQVEKRRSKVIKKTTNPVFNELFAFEMKEEELKHSSVICEVFQSDFKLKTERLGYVNLGTGQNSLGSEIRHWEEMVATPHKQILQCHNLRT